MVLDKHARLIDGNLDSSLYCEILSDNLLGTAEYYQIDHRFFVFQQDNDPKHTSRQVSFFFIRSLLLLL